MDDNKTHDVNDPTAVSRRRLLQLLAATSVVVGVDRLLPGEWATPTAEAAPDLANPAIGDLQIYFLPVDGGASYNGSVRFRYSDPAGHILSNATLDAFGDPQGIIADDQPVGDIGGKFIPYNATYGTMRFPLPGPSFTNTTESVKLAVHDSFNPSRYSNTLAGSLGVDNYGVLNISNLAVLQKTLVNASVQAADGADCELMAVFDYNGSVGGMVTPNTGVYAWLNSAGWVSAGGPISNLGGGISPIDNYSGRVRLPLTKVVNGYFGGEPDDLCLLLEGDGPGYHYATAEMMKTFVACGKPAILNLSHQLCGPSADDEDLGCQYNVTFDYYDASSKITGDSQVTVMYEGNTLVDGKSFSELGVTISNPVQGTVTIQALLPTTGAVNGAAHDMVVKLRNDDGVDSEEASTLVTDFCDPVPFFTIDISTTALTPVLLDGNASITWLAEFDFEDPAGLLSDEAEIFAAVNSSGDFLPIMNGIPIGNIGGLTPNGSFPFFPNGGLNCTVTPVNGSMGQGHFTFNSAETMALSLANNHALPVLNWFLAEPAYRQSDPEIVLLDPDVEPPPQDGYRAFVPIARGE